MAVHSEIMTVHSRGDVFFELWDIIYLRNNYPKGGSILQILKNQMISRNNLVICKKKISQTDIFKFIRYASDNIRALDLEISDNVMFTTLKSEDGDLTEVIIPVNGKVKPNGDFEYQPMFRLINAVTIRHEGSFEVIGSTEKKLTEYIEDNHFEPITGPYYVVVRNDTENRDDSIIDIYIGVNYNVL